MTLIDSRMERKTLDAMFAAMKDFLPVFRKYFRKKAEMLGHKNGLPFYDLFAPVGKTETSFTYDEAFELICRIFSGFSGKLGDFAKKAFERQWIDAEIREGKRGGAFCENLLPIGQSRIMANYSGTFNDVLTLAHELGHAYHGECLGGETPLNSHYTMPIAETASTFCETLICDAMIKSAPSAERLSILENDISGAAQVIVDIYSRFLFEDEVLRRRADGSLSVAELKEIMLDAQKMAYGDGLNPDFLHPYMWICKPHYYYSDSNYYNFPYAYGQLFSKGLYAAYLREGDAFVKKYDDLLGAAGKNSLEDIAKLADIDVTSKDFWVSSLKLYEEMINDFCRL
jgi:pepF/M3 family oligoendopeptidase